MDDTYHIQFLSSGKVRRHGIGEPLLDIISQNERTKTIVLKSPGHSYNSSGIRGMRQDIYVGTSFMVFQFVADLDGDTRKAKLLIKWFSADARRGEK